MERDYLAYFSVWENNMKTNRAIISELNYNDAGCSK
jgi:hypothetical protein